ncbi:hypothetical protein GCM10017752_02180 [Streptomyces roseoviridis]
MGIFGGFTRTAGAPGPAAVTASSAAAHSVLVSLMRDIQGSSPGLRLARDPFPPGRANPPGARRHPGFAPGPVL